MSIATFHTGHGGTITVDPSGTPVTFDGITEWKLTKTARLADTTHGGTSGWEQRKKILKGGQWSINFIWDSTNIPDTDFTLDQGDEVTLKFLVGDSTKFYSFAAIVETLEIVDNEVSDVVRGTASGFVNGAITDPVT